MNMASIIDHLENTIHLLDIIIETEESPEIRLMVEEMWMENYSDAPI